MNFKNLHNDLFALHLLFFVCFVCLSYYMNGYLNKFVTLYLMFIIIILSGCFFVCFVFVACHNVSSSSESYSSSTWFVLLLHIYSSGLRQGDNSPIGFHYSLSMHYQSLKKYF